MKQFIITFEDLNYGSDIMCITANDSVEAEATFWEVAEEEHMVVDEILGINEFDGEGDADGYMDWFHTR